MNVEFSMSVELADDQLDRSVWSMSVSVWGWVDDELAFLQPWGFDPSAIRVPTAVWYGAEDVLVPAAHGEWLARHIPGAEVRVEQRGHIGDPDRSVVELNGWLVDGRPWG